MIDGLRPPRPAKAIAKIVEIALRHFDVKTFDQPDRLSIVAIV